MNDGKSKKETAAGKEQPAATKKKSSWKYLKYILTCLVVATGAIATIAGNVDKIRTIIFGEKLEIKPSHLGNEGKSKEKKPRVAKDDVTQSCESLRVNTFPVFPYYLINSYNLAPDECYMYWARISGKNTGKRLLLIRVWFKPDPPNAEAKLEEIDTNVEPLIEIPEKERRKNPLLTIKTKMENDVILTGRWKIFPVIDGVVKGSCNQDPFSIRVVAENHIYWDLRNPEKQPVDFGFLLASLSAWCQLPTSVPPQISDRAERYYRQAKDPEGWLKACYEDLFGGPAAAVQVHPFIDPWPLRGEGLQSVQRIRTWDMVLREGKADSLEAALLLAALNNAKSMKYEESACRLVLFVLPLDEAHDQGEKRFLLAWAPRESVWRAADPKEWRAIDLTAPNKVDFDLNVQQASSLLTHVLQIQGERIFPQLNKLGVYYNDVKPLTQQSVLALDFCLAPKQYYIAGLRGE
jgi:hypothetical protein